MHFQKQDMEGLHYNWDQQNAERLFFGQPSRRLFDRFNGYQVLFLINFYGALSGKFTIQEGRQLELSLLNRLPADAKSEVSVFNWIRNGGHSPVY